MPERAAAPAPVARPMTDAAPPGDIAGAAIAVLNAGDPADKVAQSRAVAAAWRAGSLTRPRDKSPEAVPPDRPARPPRPVLMPAPRMPRRRVNSAPAGRIALLHALAHIELNAIDLAWDMVSRFAAPWLPNSFIDDWVRVGDEEATHFTMLAGRLRELGAAYGDLPAHDGLWESAQSTAHDLAARLAIVPLVLEARGLDVTPAMAAKLRAAGDFASADILDIVYRDEIGHVAIGRRWFAFVSAAHGKEPAAAWQFLVARYFKGALKRPFNASGRHAAGFPECWYEPVAPATLPED